MSERASGRSLAACVERETRNFLLSESSCLAKLGLQFESKPGETVLGAQTTPSSSTAPDQERIARLALTLWWPTRDSTPPTEPPDHTRSCAHRQV